MIELHRFDYLPVLGRSIAEAHYSGATNEIISRSFAHHNLGPYAPAEWITQTQEGLALLDSANSVALELDPSRKFELVARAIPGILDEIKTPPEILFPLAGSELDPDRLDEPDFKEVAAALRSARQLVVAAYDTMVVQANIVQIPASSLAHGN